MARYKPAHRSPRRGRVVGVGERGPSAQVPPAGPRLDRGGRGSQASGPPAEWVAFAPGAAGRVEASARPRKQHAARADQLRRRRLIIRALGVVLLVGIGVSAGGVVGTRGRSSGAPSASSAETEPSVTTPASVVSGQVGGASHTSARLLAENALAGSDGWKLTDRADNHEIEGYAGQTSVVPGQPVTLYVSTVGASFHVEVYRMGYYQGLGARLVQTSPEIAGTRQAAPRFTPGINMVEAEWSPSLVLATDSWIEGDYLLKLVSTTGKQRYVPLTVRTYSSTAAFVVINAVTTWQAYNLWGGSDLYAGQGRGNEFSSRSRTVSFDRPYALGDGAGDFLGLEYPLVSLVESLGLDVTYVTDLDLENQPNPLLGHRAVISLGHDEYYSLAMRHALEQARDGGVNLAFLGANAVFRHIRLAPSPLGADRREINYKSAREDPLYGRDNADVTVDWREPPNNNPESQLIGDFYQCNPVHADMVVVDPGNWLFEGTGASAGQRLRNVVGSEYDRYDPTVPGPPNVEIITHSPVRCQGKADFADATYYSAPSGAGVFAAGTIYWVGNIDAHCQPDDCAGRVLGLVMKNLLSVFGAGPAGLVHPSQPGQSSVHSRPPVSTTVPPAGGGRGSGSGAAIAVRPAWEQE